MLADLLSRMALDETLIFGISTLQIQLLSLGSISHGAIAGVSRSWLRETVSLVPFLALLLMRNCKLCFSSQQC